MDARTRAAYDAEADDLAVKWSRQPPTQMYALITRHFTTGRTVDIGCGAGRDVDWLNAHGYPTIGVDGSANLLGRARRAYPTGSFVLDYLPDLLELGDQQFQNVLCQTVLPHLPEAQVDPAVTRLRTLLMPGGVLYLSWRVVPATVRDESGRLYTKIDADVVLAALADTTVIHDHVTVGASSGKDVRRLVARLPDQCER